MTSVSCFALVFLTLLLMNVKIEGFQKFNQLQTLHSNKFSRIQSSKQSNDLDIKSFKSLAPLIASASIQTFPVAAFADDGSGTNPFVYPLIISVLTMVPFLWYQQQLAPKPRAAKQIELDENLKPRNKAEQSAGREGVARASKRR